MNFDFIQVAYLDLDLSNVFINDKGEIATPQIFITKEEALKMFPSYHDK